LISGSLYTNCVKPLPIPIKVREINNIPYVCIPPTGSDCIPPSQGETWIGNELVCLYDDIIVESVEFENEVTIYEKFIKCTISDSELNLSYNPTLQERDLINCTDPYPKEIIDKDSGSLDINYDRYTLMKITNHPNFNPFFTQIGLYDNNHNLLAIGKYSSPIPIHKHLDMNLLIKFTI